MNKSALFASLALAFTQPVSANINIVFDYTYDSNGFFSSNADSQTALEAAASVFETRFADTLSAITSGGTNSFDPIFFNPEDPYTQASDVQLIGQSYTANEIRIYVGGADLGSGTLGLGGPGGWGCSGIGAFCSNADSRGQGIVSGSGADDFALWGGSISFNNASTWHFGQTTSGLDSNEADFYSVAVHELAHVLGFGTADSHYNLADLNTLLYSGSASTAAFGGNVPLDGDGAHWADGTMSVVNGNAQETAMDPVIFLGSRKYFTDLDFAAMQDIGWEVTPVPEADTWAMLLAGLCVVGWATRRRS